MGPRTRAVRSRHDRLRRPHRPPEHDRRRAALALDADRGPRVRLDLDLGPLLLGRLQGLHEPRSRRPPHGAGVPHDPRALRLARLLRGLPAPGGAGQGDHHDRPPLGRPGRHRARGRAGRSTSTRRTASRSRAPVPASTSSRSRRPACAPCCATTRPTFKGKHFSLTDARNEPRPVQDALPIWIGGSGERRTLRIAARYADGWNVPFISPEIFAHKKGVLAERCAEIGRDPGEIRCSVNVGLALDEDALQRQFGGLAEATRPGVLMGSGQQIVDGIGRYVEAGADQINLAMRAPFEIDGLETLAAAVGRAVLTARPHQPSATGEIPSTNGLNRSGVGSVGPPVPTCCDDCRVGTCASEAGQRGSAACGSGRRGGGPCGDGCADDPTRRGPGRRPRRPARPRPARRGGPGGTRRAPRAPARRRGARGPRRRARRRGTGRSDVGEHVRRRRSRRARTTRRCRRPATSTVDARSARTPARRATARSAHLGRPGRREPDGPPTARRGRQAPARPRPPIGASSCAPARRPP